MPEASEKDKLCLRHLKWVPGKFFKLRKNISGFAFIKVGTYACSLNARNSGGLSIRVAVPSEIILKDCIFLFILIGLLFHFENSVINENVKGRWKINQELRERQTTAAENFAPPQDMKLTQ
ncbi:hypothetical protein AVEN_167714-1 [Araneus ventricosus]|uniref:Uncharacterized protein n=1 Tax=Araneus ventricosus TaxID=182803 RepID=A0A4Y2QKG1_ARAVE|nr:hypothetical protein AVEN_167714-1 [Araneus ventricosus]